MCLVLSVECRFRLFSDLVLYLYEVLLVERV